MPVKCKFLQSKLDQPIIVYDCTFDFFRPLENGNYERTHEEHVQYIYSYPQFCEFFKKAMLELEAVYSEFSFSTDLESSSRMQFVLSAGGIK